MDEASALLELQERDLEILRAERALAELPEKRAILEVRAKQREVATLKHKADVLVSKLEAELRRSQDETDSVTGKIAAEQAKIMSGEIADHKTGAAYLARTGRPQASPGQARDANAADHGAHRKGGGQREKVDEALAQLAAREASYVERFKEHGGELQTLIATATARREKLAHSLSPGLLARYEALREQKAGIGVGRLVEGSARRVEWSSRRAP